MSLRKKIILFTSFLVILLFILGLVSVGKKTDPITQFIKSVIPNNFKVILKKTLFSIPTLNQKAERHEIKLNEFNEKLLRLDAQFKYLVARPKVKKIKSKLNTYNIKTYRLPFPRYFQTGGEPVA